MPTKFAGAGGTLRAHWIPKLVGTVRGPVVGTVPLVVGEWTRYYSYSWLLSPVFVLEFAFGCGGGLVGEASANGN